MSFVGSGVLGQRLDQPTLLNNFQNEKDDENENQYPRPLDFQKKGEKLDYFDALRDLPGDHVDRGEPRPLQPTRKQNQYRKPKFQAQKPKVAPKKPKETTKQINGKHLPKKQYTQYQRGNNNNKGKVPVAVIAELNSSDNESATESHACSNCVCKCYDPVAKGSDQEGGGGFSAGGSDNEEDCACGDCGRIYAEEVVKYQNQQWNDKMKFDFPRNFTEQCENVPYQDKPRGKKVQAKEGFKRYNDPSMKIRSSPNRSMHTQGSRSPMSSFSPSPEPGANLQEKIKHQKRKVEKLRKKVESEKSIVSNNTKKSKSQKSVSYSSQQQQPVSQRHSKHPSKASQYSKKSNLSKVSQSISNVLRDSDHESPENYGVKPHKTPRLGKIAVTNAQELAVRNNILYKQRQMMEEEKKEIEKQDKEYQKRKLKLFNEKIKNHNLNQFQHQKKTHQTPKQEKQKWDWGVNQKAIEDFHKPKPKKEVIPSQKPENVRKYNQVEKFFDNVPSKWLENMQNRVKNEINDIKRPKSLPRRRSLEIVRTGQDPIEQAKPFRYLRSKSTKAVKGQPQLQNKNRKHGEVSPDTQLRQQTAYYEIVQKKQKQEKQKQKVIKQKLKNLDQKQKNILAQTKKVKFVPPEDIEERGFTFDEEMEKGGFNKSITRFNLPGQKEQQVYYSGENQRSHTPSKKKKAVTYGNLDVNEHPDLPEDKNDKLRYDRYKKHYRKNYDDGYDIQEGIQQVFSKKVPPKSYKANDRLAIGFQSKNEQQQEKEKNVDHLVDWSKEKLEQEMQEKKKIMAEQQLKKLEEERQIHKEEKRMKRSKKKLEAGNYDDYGYNKQTGQYDPFFDKYKTQNLEKDPSKMYDEFEDDESDQEFQRQIEIQKKQIDDLKYGKAPEKSPGRDNSLNQTKQKFGNHNQQYPPHPQQPQQFYPQQQQQQQYPPPQYHQQQQQQPPGFLPQYNSQPYEFHNEQIHYDDQLRGQVRFADKFGGPLDPEYANYLIQKEAQLSDMPKGLKQRQYDQQGNVIDEDYRELEDHMKKQLWSRNNEKVKNQGKKKAQQVIDMEQRKEQEWQKAQMEVNKLKQPNIDNMFREDGTGKFGEEDRPEDWGEFDGIKLEGTKPYWDDIKNNARNNINDDTDSDVYEKEKIDDTAFGNEDDEVLDRIDRYNDYLVRRNVQKGKQRRIPIDESKKTVYARRCRDEKQKRQEYNELRRDFGSKQKDDSTDDELNGGGFQKYMQLDFKKNDKVFGMAGDELLKLDHFKIN